MPLGGRATKTNLGSAFDPAAHYRLASRRGALGSVEWQRRLDVPPLPVNLEILGADVASQCFRRGLVDEILVYVLPVLLGDGILFWRPGASPQDRPGTGQQHAVGRHTILPFRVRK
jgi:hypothetical protein